MDSGLAASAAPRNDQRMDVIGFMESMHSSSTRSLRPQVLEMDLALENPLRVEGPRVILTDFTERIQPREPARTASLAPVPAGRRNRTISFGLAGIGAFVALWFAVDAVSWISAAFDHSTALGVLAAAAVAAGLAGAGAVITREATSLFRLRSVEAIQERFRCGLGALAPAEARQVIAEILAVVPRDRGIAQGIESFQRQAQPHHNTVQ